MVFKAANPLIDYTLYLKGRPPKLTGDNGAVVLMQFFKNMGQCGGASAAASLNGYHVCKYQLKLANNFADGRTQAHGRQQNPHLRRPRPHRQVLRRRRFTPDVEGYGVW